MRRGSVRQRYTLNVKESVVLLCRRDFDRIVAGLDEAGYIPFHLIQAIRLKRLGAVGVADNPSIYLYTDINVFGGAMRVTLFGACCIQLQSEALLVIKFFRKMEIHLYAVASLGIAIGEGVAELPEIIVLLFNKNNFRTCFLAC